MGIEYRELEETDVKVKLVWTDAPTPQLTSVTLCQASDRIVIMPDRLEALERLVHWIIADRNIQKDMLRYGLEYSRESKEME